MDSHFEIVAGEGPKDSYIKIDGRKIGSIEKATFEMGMENGKFKKVLTLELVSWAKVEILTHGADIDATRKTEE
ncbi:hypothetical protein [Brevibacillus laterosporus]|uniref:Uncharacterized protein n=1 Tax=Brevibacillus laterosporus TaxID=1465 RepID=A0AAP8QG30_BRELA|nr:hypothetical protein [Brevibacillus laterosporus]PPB10909.1 hypothetical protein C4A77_04605 [Brevibacillus laterosporus]